MVENDSNIYFSLPSEVPRSLVIWSTLHCGSLIALSVCVCVCVRARARTCACEQSK